MQWDNPISPDSAGSTLVIRIPRGLRSKEKLLGIFAERLRFPRYFGWNWDAFEECLRDLSWLPEGQAITVVHEALPFSEGDNRETYLSILSNWRATAQRSIKLILLEVG